MRGARREILPALTGLRFIAALSVAVSHSLAVMTNMPNGEPMWHHWLQYSSAFGMSAFFVLSGFVIHYNYAEPITVYGFRGVTNFFAARFARLYPLYLVCLVLSLYDHGYFFPLIVGTPHVTGDFWTLLPRYLTMTQSWTYSVVGSNALIYGYPFSVVIADTWSISTEFFFYLIYPFVCFGFTRLRRPLQTLVVAGLLVTCALALLYLAYAHGGAIDQFGVQHFGPIAGLANGYQDSFLRWLIYFAPYSRLPEFLLGCLIAVLYQQLESREPLAIERRLGQLLPYVAIIVIIGFVLIITSSRNPFPFLAFLHQNFGLALPVAVLIFCVARYQNAIGRVLSSNWMVLCGDASYSIYMLHPLIVRNAGLDAVPIGTSSTLTSVVLMRMMIALIATVGFSLLTYRALEVPARRLLRRLLTVGTGMPVASTQSTAYR